MTELKQPISSKLCSQFGFDGEKRFQRLRLLDLLEDDNVIAETLIKKVIRPNIVAMVDGFYEQLMTDPIAFQFIGDPELLNRLKKIQSNYLLNLGVNFKSEAYFESRLRAGLAHAWVGLPLVTYQCGYYIQQKIIIQFINQLSDKSEAEALINFLLKIIALDMSLAVEMYHNIQVKGLSQTLDRVQFQHRQLLKKSTTDSLTHVLTRAQVLAELNQRIKFTREKKLDLSVIMVDIDFFKQVNDKYGHQTGDHVLKQVAKRFKSAVRSVDLVGRFGGEEFLIVLPNADQKVASRIAERVRTHVSTTPVKCDDVYLDISVSEGVAELIEDDNAKSLIARADKALYEAKNSGRNRVVCLDVKVNG